ncbi:hypothetical protein GCM10011409_18990 [Lentibacillus populi]|uniref:Minor capsid protein n=1 Tax=Lentibacillus populi TaxID=1827502 RepID=A0A9W5TY75_9BACI|nr:phage minor capsid protein [Lentibacillus populi]GGB41669.1 hypothetical protein GCM10011409_18990 [Lentibacillus populi]
MNSEQLLEITKVLKLEILELLQNTNLANDKNAQQTLQTIDNMFSRLDIAVEDVIPAESLKAYLEGVDEATKALSGAGINPTNGLAASISGSGQVSSAFNNHVHLAAIAEITDNTMLDLKAAIRTARKNTNASIEAALTSVKRDLQSGIIQGKSRKVITKRVAESFAKEGMTSFTTVDGKKLPLDFYSEVVTRTNLKSANVQGANNRYLENGVGLVEIFERSDGCAECAKYNGIVVSLTGKHEGFPTTEEAPLPPRHANCRGSVRPYVIEHKTDKEIEDAKKKWKSFDPNKDTRTVAQKKAYEEQQRLNRINNYEKKRYADIKGVLGDDAPANLGAFKRMKRANTDNYNKLIQDYQDTLKSIKK